MNIQTLSRKEKRARIAKAAKVYGIKGEESLALHQAYMALGAGDVAEAVRLVHPVTKSHPDNAHSWIILGGAALAKREGATAKAFFTKAADITPKAAIVMAGMAKAHVLCAEVEDACDMSARAIAAGSEDVGLIKLYLQLMGRLGRRLSAADVVAPAARKIDDAALSLTVGDFYAEAEETGRAVEWLDRAWRLDPTPESHQIARLRALLYSLRLTDAESMARDLIDDAQDRDTVALILLTSLRVQRRLDEAEEMAESFEFATPEGFAQARAIVANILQDRGDAAIGGAADSAYVEALNVTDDTGRIAKAYGVFRFRGGDFAGGAPFFDQRFPEAQRRRSPLENSAADALATRDRVILLTEQGIGDQLALLTLLKIAPVKSGAEISFVGDARMGDLLRGNTLGVNHIPQEVFLAGQLVAAPNELIYLGDLTRFLADRPAADRHGPILNVDSDRRARLRKSYESQANGAPIIGVAWASRSLIGVLRSIPLADMVADFPENALVVNLQYGATKDDIAAAKAARPDLTFVTDTHVDQMADLAGFAAQIAALDRVITIDNTTAHMCGAIGHSDSHVLLPTGSECMWYWGAEGQDDPWYGALNLHRQERAGDWSAPLAALRAI